MKKSLIALAVLAASGAAMAQSSVTLYGVADVGFAHENNGIDSVNRMDSGNLNGSRWGLKGSEDLGGGLKAIFTLEAGLNLDTGAASSSSSFFNRQSFVGVSSNFGTVKLGRQVNPIYATSSTWDSFADGLAGDSAHLFNYNGSRTDNMVSYNYASNGFYGELQYGLGEVAGNNSITGANSAGRTAAMFVGYKAGPFDVVLTHQNIHQGKAAVAATLTAAGIPVAAIPAVAYDTAAKMTLLGGNYDFGVVKLFAAYAVEKSVGVNAKNQKDAHLGLTAPVGTAGLVELSYLRKKDDLNANNAHQVAIGYIHNLSKRTALYTSYAQLNNEGAAHYSAAYGADTSATSIPAGKLTAQPGLNDKVFDIGIRHSF